MVLVVVLRPSTPRIRPGEGVLDGNARSGVVGWSALTQDGSLSLHPTRFDNDAANGEGPGGARSGLEIKRDGGDGDWAYALAAMRRPEAFFRVGQVYRMQVFVRDLDASGEQLGLLVANGRYAHRPTTATVYAGFKDSSWHVLTRMFVATQPAAADTGLYLALPPKGSLNWQVTDASVEKVDAAVPTRTTGPATSVIKFTGKAGAAPDPRQWVYADGGQTSSDAQSYTSRPANAQLDGAGNLVLTVRHESTVGADKVRRAFSSAKVTTAGKVAVAPGSYVEAELQAPPGSGVSISPSFALIGTSIAQAGWPASGELDVLGFSQDAAHLAARTDATVDYPYRNDDTSDAQSLVVDDGQPHRYGVYFDGRTVRFYVDRHERLALWAADADASGRTWPFGAPQYVCLDVAVSAPGTAASSLTFPERMTVGPISVWSGGVPF